MIADITDALLAHLKGAHITAPIAWPGANFTPADGNYVQVSIFYSPATAATLTSHDERTGLMQATVFWPAGKGIIAPLDLVDTIIDRFPRNTTIRGNSREVRVTQPPYAAAALQEAGWLQVPVTIPWTSWVRT